MTLKYLTFIALIALGSCNESDKNEETIEPQLKIETIEIGSTALQNAFVEVNTIQKAKVLLPPYYEHEPNKKYPVLYFVHGYGGSYKDSYGIFGAAYEEMVEKRIDDFIVVTVNSECKTGGTFCVNSPVTGNWEDHITKEVIEYIDNNYRTKANKESRGIAGFSMGGFGCLYLGLRHADKYNLVYAIAPGVLKDGDLKAADNIWVRDGGSFRDSYGATFSPNTELNFPHAEKPKFDGTENDNKIVENWNNGFGNFNIKVADYLAGEHRLKKIGLEYGTGDYYAWIPRGTVDLANIFAEKNINYSITKIPVGMHEVNIEYVKSTMLPFFSEGFASE